MRRLTVCLVAFLLIGGVCGEARRFKENAYFPRGKCKGDAIEFRYVDAEGRDAIGRADAGACVRLSPRAWETLWAVRCLDTETGATSEWAWEAEGPLFAESLPDDCP